MLLESHAFQAALLGMDRVRARDLLGKCWSEEGRTQTLEGVVVPAMERIGMAWEQGHIALAQVYMAGRICEEAVETILPANSDGEGKGPRIGLAVFEDQHQLGKRIVASVLRSAGYRLKDFGVGVDTPTLVRALWEDPVPVLMVSVLMLHTALHLKSLRGALSALPRPPVLIAGGAPFRFDPTLGLEVGVDAIGTSAADALRLAQQYLGVPCSQ
jgi:methanogenic corrinoid protein MtbC1